MLLIILASKFQKLTIIMTKYYNILMDSSRCCQADWSFFIVSLDASTFGEF